jgi:hypothetical protein
MDCLSNSLTNDFLNELTSNISLLGLSSTNRNLYSSELSLSLILRPTVSRPVYLGIKHPSGAYDQIFISL